MTNLTPYLCGAAFLVGAFQFVMLGANAIMSRIASAANESPAYYRRRLLGALAWGLSLWLVGCGLLAQSVQP